MHAHDRASKVSALARRLVLFGGLIALGMTGCAGTSAPKRIALLAPFEGRYREIGYDALYAARLALREGGVHGIELYAVDDGGTPGRASDRVAALARDPLVMAILTLGPTTTQDTVLETAADLPTIVVGFWRAPSHDPGVFWLTGALDQEADDRVFYPGLRAVLDIWNDGTDEIRFESSAAPPDESFVARYQQGEQFAPRPTPQATLVYDATSLVIHAASMAQSRADLVGHLTGADQNGYNGHIRFLQGRWTDVPLYIYLVTPLSLRRVQLN